VNLLQSLGLARNAEGEGSLLLLVFRDARMVQSVVFQRGPKSNRERGPDLRELTARIVAVRPVCAVALVLVALVPQSAAARNPWSLRCPSMPREQRVPAAVRPAAHAFFPWARRSGENALRSGPIYLLALSFRSQISRDGDDSDGAGNDLHRALVAVAPSYSKRVVITGRRIGRARPHSTLAFSTNGASRCTVSGVDVSCVPRLLREARALKLPARTGWRIVRTELAIGRTGCFRIVARGRGLRAVLPMAVPGPDWR